MHLVELCTGLSARRERENMTEREKALADKIMQAELFKMNKERTEYLKDKHGDKILEDDALKAMRILADCVLPSLISDKRDRFFDGYRKYLEYAMNICQYCDAHTHGGNEMARGLYWRMGKALAYGSFEWFILCMERNRDPLKKFYAPRKEVLRPIVEDLQKFENATKQKFYGLSTPSRIGKSTIALLFMAWVALRKPNSHSAMGGHSGMLAKGFWKELMNFFTSSEYCFEEMYRLHHPEYANQPMIIDKSAEDLTITFGDADRFATITCRGIDGTWTGAVDVSSDGYLYVDDLVRDREHSLNPVRMENTWQEYLNKMVDRKNDGAKELMVGTLWNIYDPLNRLANMYADNNAYKFRKIPALDYKTDESNFNYAINGFSTQYYREMRERLDEAEWMAKFQQNPQIREGILFTKADLHRFSEIPNSGQFYVWCDPALGGGDFTSMPIVIEADGKYKVVDWLYNNASPKVTVPKIVDKIIKWHIPHLGIEYNGGAGALVHKELKDELTRRDALWCEIEPEYANTRLSKADKIKGRADFVKDNFEFLEDLLQEDEYKKAFNDMCIYTTIGKNVHDDSADSITSLALKIRPFSENGTVYIPDVNPFRQYGGRIY